MEITANRTKFYAQNKEDQIVLDYFKGKTGTFLDLGSNDGITLSNTRALSESGWCGVFVEPSPAAFASLKSNYAAMQKEKCFYYYNVAIGNKNGKVPFFESGTHLKNGDVALLSTMHESEKRRWGNTMEFTPIEVQAYRWKTFFNRLSIKTFDFISIDVEGNDKIVLEQMDLEALDCSCLCIEWNGVGHLKTFFTEYAGKAGLKPIYESPENLIFVK